jgi:hypothetical protein
MFCWFDECECGANNQGSDSTCVQFYLIFYKAGRERVTHDNYGTVKL